MFAGISGAQSTGKTTLIEMLRGSGYNVFTLVARTVMKDHPINQDGDDGTQRAIIDTHLRNLDRARDTCFMDRCLLDGFVFTLYGARHGKVSAQCLAEIYRDFYNNVDRYDYIVYLEPEFDIVPDGTRAVDTQFRDELCEIYELVISTLKVPVVRPKGDPLERLKMVTEFHNSMLRR